MSNVSSCIAPLPKLHVGEGSVAPRTWSFEDSSVTIYPKLPSGQSIRVVILRFSLTSSQGTVFHACRNAGKWSYRVDYAMKSKTTRMPKVQWVAELKRLGGFDYAMNQIRGVK